MITFRIGRHIERAADVCEVLLDGRVCAVIYPGKNDFTLVSAHMKNVVRGTGEAPLPQFPFVSISFEPRPYRLGPNGEIVRDHDG